MSRLALVPVNVPSLPSAPSTPTLRAGDLYHDSTAGTLSFYTGSAWTNLSSVIFTGFDGGTATTTSFDLILDLGVAA